MAFTLSVRPFQSGTPAPAPAPRACRRCPPRAPPRHLRGEPVQLIHHRVDGALSSRIFPLHVHRDLLDRSPLATAVVTSGCAHWPVRFAAHRVDVVGEVLPSPCRSGHCALPRACRRLPTAAATAIPPRRTRSVDHHRFDGALQLEDLALTSTVIFFDRSPWPRRGHPPRCCAPGPVRFAAID